uniref:PIPK domain-containing protein n=1 Tax=Macrostomum lignano TaxID=282301 RepID=A0A1I8IY12_9PLAT
HEDSGASPDWCWRLQRDGEPLLDGRLRRRNKGELGKGCCLPTQWEDARQQGRLDYPGKKVAARTMSLLQERLSGYYTTRTVADFNAKKAYFIYKDKCKTFKLRRTTSDWRPKKMKSDVEVASLVEDDFLRQMMDLIDGQHGAGNGRRRERPRPLRRSGQASLASPPRWRWRQTSPCGGHGKT